MVLNGYTMVTCCSGMITRMLLPTGIACRLTTCTIHASFILQLAALQPAQPCTIAQASLRLACPSERIISSPRGAHQNLLLVQLSSSSLPTCSSAQVRAHTPDGSPDAAAHGHGQGPHGWGGPHDLLGLGLHHQLAQQRHLEPHRRQQQGGHCSQAHPRAHCGVPGHVRAPARTWLSSAGVMSRA